MNVNVGGVDNLSVLKARGAYKERIFINKRILLRIGFRTITVDIAAVVERDDRVAKRRDARVNINSAAIVGGAGIVRR